MISAKEKISKFLNSSWFISFTTVLALLCYEFKVAEITIGFFVLLCAYVFIFEDDVTPLLIIPIYAPFILDRTFKWTMATTIYFAILAAIFIGTLICFFVRQFKYKKHKIKLGKMFWPGVVILFVLLIAGVGTANFVYAKWWKQILFPFVLFLFYMFTVNFTRGDNRRYIAKLFVGVAVFIMSQMLWFLLKSSNPISVIQGKGILVGNGNMINAAGTFLAIAIPFCFYLANNSKRDWLYCVLGLLIYLFLLLSGCRGGLLVATLLLPVGFIISMVKSKEKKRYFIILICASIVIIAGLVMVIINRDVVLGAFVRLGLSGNGRIKLYELGWENFLKTPITGTGIYAPEVLPGFPTTVYYYHNTPLMILACTGIVGFVGFAYYYFKKFKIFFTNASLFKTFTLLALITIEGYGLFDIHGFNPLMVLITLIFVVTAENEENPEMFKSVKEELQTFKAEMKELTEDLRPKKKEEISSQAESSEKENKKVKKIRKNNKL